MTVVQAFRTALFDEVRAGATTTIDLSNVTFLGVGGLRALVEAREWAAQHDCRLHLVASPVVWRMLEIIGKAGDFNR
ncbi:STAS domain-containing protein [Nocardia huaxiensis]|uniref:STAS domain-containing protein n=2 Tax=Nocardia huaxiensis TaxID=2755382 RepID=A0A7D6ZMB2_9NOCA|nr:STAS domain-containing protein [Nocardia huaxiensis]QLY29125.1 STAS domain-containing protein [Nocardia huaxiensis]UFS97382.1 STAS domain-containing protein [Nocardia huaxiensis]